MEMNEYTHTLLALGCMYGTYLLGRFFEKKGIERVLSPMF